MAQAAAMHGCHIAALKIQLHAAMQQQGIRPCAEEQEHGGAAEASASAAAPANDDVAGYMRTISELRAALEDKSREAAEAVRSGVTPSRKGAQVARAELDRHLEQQRRALEADKAASLQSLKDLFQRCAHQAPDALAAARCGLPWMLTRLHTGNVTRPLSWSPASLLPKAQTSPDNPLSAG